MKNIKCTKSALITFSGASASGKSTIMFHLAGIPLWKELGIICHILTSTTTRTRRATGELPFEYEFVSNRKFGLFESKNAFEWTAAVHGQQYGTRTAHYTRAVESSEIYMMAMSPDRTPDLFSRMKKVGKLYLPFYIRVADEEVLKTRLIERGENPENVASRLAHCRYWDEQELNSGFPYIVVDNTGPIEETVGQVKAHLARTLK